MARNQNYKGSIDLIGGLRPKNNGTFPLLDAHDVQVEEDGTRLDDALQNTVNVKTDLEAYADNLHLAKIYHGEFAKVGYDLDVEYAGKENDQLFIQALNAPENLDSIIVYLFRADGSYQTAAVHIDVGKEYIVTANKDFVKIRLHYTLSSYPTSEQHVSALIGAWNDSNIKNAVSKVIDIMHALRRNSLLYGVSVTDGIYLSSKGVKANLDGYSVTDFIPVVPGSTVGVYGELGELTETLHNVWAYDADKKPITGLIHWPSEGASQYIEAELAENVQYIRVCTKEVYKNSYAVCGDKPENIVHRDDPFVLPSDVYTTAKPLYSHLNGITKLTNNVSVFWSTGATEWGSRSKPFDMLDWSEIPNNANVKVVVESGGVVAYAKEIRVHKKTTNPADNPLKLMCIGDSITNRGLGLMVRSYLSNAYRMSSVTNVGTMTNNNDQKGEGREGWKYTNFVGLDWTSQNGVAISPQLTQADGSLSKNPFVRTATSSDDANKIYPYNGINYIFDFSNYLSVQQVNSPDVVVIALSTNDILSGNSAYISDCKKAMTIMVESITASLPSAHVAIVPTFGFAMTKGGNALFEKALKWAKACIDTCASFSDHVSVVMSSMFVDRMSAYPMTKTEFTSADNNLSVASVSDIVHTSVINAHADAIARWVVNVLP